MGNLRIVRVDRYLNPETHGCLERSILVCCFIFFVIFSVWGGHKIFFRAEEDVSVSEVLNKHEDLWSVSSSKRKEEMNGWMDGWMNKLVKARHSGLHLKPQH